MKLKITNQGDQNNSPEIVQNALEELLNEEHLCSMASVTNEGKPHINTAFFAHRHGSKLYFLSEPESLHTANFATNSEIAITVAASTQRWGEPLRGVQLFGSCNHPSVASVAIGYQTYASRFLRFSDWIKSPKELLSGACETRLFEVHINRGKLFDERNFGKDTYIEFEIGESNGL